MYTNTTTKQEFLRAWRLKVAEDDECGELEPAAASAEKENDSEGYASVLEYTIEGIKCLVEDPKNGPIYAFPLTETPIEIGALRDGVVEWYN